MINVLSVPSYSEPMYVSKEEAEQLMHRKPVCALCDAGHPITQTRVQIPIYSIDGKPTNGGYMLASLEFAQKLKKILDEHGK